MSIGQASGRDDDWPVIPLAGWTRATPADIEAHKASKAKGQGSTSGRTVTVKSRQEGKTAGIPSSAHIWTGVLTPHVASCCREVGAVCYGVKHRIIEDARVWVTSIGQVRLTGRQQRTMNIAQMLREIGDQVQCLAQSHGKAPAEAVQGDTQDGIRPLTWAEWASPAKAAAARRRAEYEAQMAEAARHRLNLRLQALYGVDMGKGDETAVWMTTAAGKQESE